MNKKMTYAVLLLSMLAARASADPFEQSLERADELLWEKANARAAARAVRTPESLSVSVRVACDRGKRRYALSETRILAVLSGQDGAPRAEVWWNPEIRFPLARWGRTLSLSGDPDAPTLNLIDANGKPDPIGRLRPPPYACASDESGERFERVDIDPSVTVELTRSVRSGADRCRGGLEIFESKDHELAVTQWLALYSPHSPPGSGPFLAVYADGSMSFYSWRECEAFRRRGYGGR